MPQVERTTNKIKRKELAKTRAIRKQVLWGLVVVWLWGVGMFISRVGIITLSFALGRAWGRLFFAPVSVGNMIKGKKEVT